MLFNSSNFILFFIVVITIYYFPLNRNLKAQNWLLFLSSYFFYGYVNWKIVPILFIATAVFFSLGISIANCQSQRRSSALTTLGALLGIGLLVYFKYFNFFIDSFSTLLSAIGLQSNIGTFDIIMPLGISYFTFKMISYIIEIHRGKITASQDFVAFGTYISFFPTILSGPIDKPYKFIPQLEIERSFNYDLTVNGCRQILWGLFQKIVIADNLASTVNHVWSDLPNQSGGTLCITSILYSIQLYTDFSGYSHIAIGIGKILGFRITQNFNYPFFSRNVAEFWRNWHISLTSWLTDYIFMPLNIKFRSFGTIGIILAIMINMLVVGIWHGANWTFALFGLYNGLLFIPLILSGSLFVKNKLKTNQFGLPSFLDFSKILVTFTVITLGLIVFRSDNIVTSYNYIMGIFNFNSKAFLDLSNSNLAMAIPAILYAIIFFVIEWHTRKEEFSLATLGLNWSRPVRFTLYYVIIFIIFLFQTQEQQFIYFQF